MSLRAVIADDEPLARKKIRRLLEAERDVEIVAECRNGEETIRAVRDASPDLLFLDIAMPEHDGFEVVRAIEGDGMPAVVFVTAHDEYAVQAFEVHAVDYLLKPFDRDRFATALDAARGRALTRGEGDLSRRLLRALEGMSKKPEYSERISVKKAGKIFFLEADEIRWVDAAGNYVRLNTADGSFLLRETMTNMEKKLDPERFVRIHRSTIVNLEEIREIEPLQHGEYAVILDGGKRLTLSRSHRGKLGRILG